MPVKRNRQGKTRKEIDAISERLHGTGNANTIRVENEKSRNSGGKQASKEEIESMVERLYEKDPMAKRKELQEKHNMDMDKDRSVNLGWKESSKDDVESLTSRLFIADYTNRNVGKETVTAVNNGKEMSKEERDAAIERLFISDYSNRNLVKNQQFYDVIMNKKKSEEKVQSKDESDESIARLSKMTREPASCNKDMLGKKTYTERGIYGTYAMNGGNAPAITKTNV